MGGQPSATARPHFEKQLLDNKVPLILVQMLAPVDGTQFEEAEAVALVAVGAHARGAALELGLLGHLGESALRQGDGLGRWLGLLGIRSGGRRGQGEEDGTMPLRRRHCG